MLYELIFDEKNGLKAIGDIIWSYRSRPLQLMQKGTENEILKYLKYSLSYTARKVANKGLLVYKNAKKYKLEVLKAILSGLCQECGGRLIAKRSMVTNTQQNFCENCYLEAYGPFITLGEFQHRTHIDTVRASKAKPPRYWSFMDDSRHFVWRCREVDIEKIVKYHTNKRKKRKTE